MYQSTYVARHCELSDNGEKQVKFKRSLEKGGKKWGEEGRKKKEERRKEEGNKKKGNMNFLYVWQR